LLPPELITCCGRGAEATLRNMVGIQFDRFSLEQEEREILRIAPT
jgi:hypothetical protein